jgi:hypothetical protein
MPKRQPPKSELGTFWVIVIACCGVLAIALIVVVVFD